MVFHKPLVKRMSKILEKAITARMRRLGSQKLRPSPSKIIDSIDSSAGVNMGGYR